MSNGHSHHESKTKNNLLLQAMDYGQNLLNSSTIVAPKSMSPYTSSSSTFTSTYSNGYNNSGYYNSNNQDYYNTASYDPSRSTTTSTTNDYQPRNGNRISHRHFENTSNQRNIDMMDV